MTREITADIAAHFLRVPIMPEAAGGDYLGRLRKEGDRMQMLDFAVTGKGGIKIEPSGYRWTN